MKRDERQKTSETAPTTGEERLQKVLARAGVASRRHCEELIAQGRVTIDGVVCDVMGTKVDPRRQRIEVDGRSIAAERLIALLLHKPTSYVTTVTDPEGRRTVMDLLEDVPERVYPVGRLDYDTTGLLLLTNDGELTNRLLHPRHAIGKVYRVTILDMPEKAAVAKLREGVMLDDGVTKPADVKVLRTHPRESVIELTIHEGRNRQIRRMCEAVGMTIKRLKRIQFGVLELGDLKVGASRMLTKTEWASLYSSVGLPVPDYPVTTTAGSDARQRKSSRDPSSRPSHHRSVTSRGNDRRRRPGGR